MIIVFFVILYSHLFVMNEWSKQTQNHRRFVYRFSVVDIVNYERLYHADKFVNIPGARSIFDRD